MFIHFCCSLFIPHAHTIAVINLLYIHYILGRKQDFAQGGTTPEAQSGGGAPLRRAEGLAAPRPLRQAGFIANEDFWSPAPPPPYRIDFAKNGKKQNRLRMA